MPVCKCLGLICRKNRTDTEQPVISKLWLLITLLRIYFQNILTTFLLHYELFLMNIPKIHWLCFVPDIYLLINTNFGFQLPNTCCVCRTAAMTTQIACLTGKYMTGTQKCNHCPIKYIKTLEFCLWKFFKNARPEPIKKNQIIQI